VATLEGLGLSPSRGGTLRGFAGDDRPVDLQVRLADGHCLGWCRQVDGSLALVGDLQRISRCHALPELIGRITRSYAAHKALLEAAATLPEAVILGVGA
jgi:hypothetical protein